MKEVVSNKRRRGDEEAKYFPFSLLFFPVFLSLSRKTQNVASSRPENIRWEEEEEEEESGLNPTNTQRIET